MSKIIALTLKNIKKIGLERKIPNISEQNAEYIKNLIREKNPKHILEIGTANGYSTLCFMQAVMDSRGESLENSQKQEVRGGEDFSMGLYGGVNEQEKSGSNDEIHSFSGFSLTTIEYAWNAHIEAIEHFKNCKTKNIHAIWGDAKVVIPTLADGYFDFVFIDAMKREYLTYLKLALPKMTPDALIVIDDVEKFASKMGDLYEYIDNNNINHKIVKSDIDDSIMILCRSDISLTY